MLNWQQWTAGKRSSLIKVHDRSLPEIARKNDLDVVNLIDRGLVFFKQGEATAREDLNEYLYAIQLAPHDAKYDRLQLRNGAAIDSDVLDRDLLFLSYGEFNGLYLDTSELGTYSQKSR